MNSTNELPGEVPPVSKRFLPQGIIDLLEFVSIHLWLLFATGTGVIVIWYVPQISNLWQQRPYGGVESLGFGFLLVLLVWFYPITLFWLWQRTLLQVWKPEWRTGAISWCAKWRWCDYVLRLVFGPSRILTKCLHTIAFRSAGLSNGVAGVFVVLILIVFGFVLSYWVPVQWHRPWLMSGGFVRMTGLWVILVGIWLAFGKWFGSAKMLQPTNISKSANEDPDERRRRVWHAAGRVLSWMAAVSVLGELLWIAAALEIPIVSYRLYSIWAAIHIPVVVAVLAALVDFAQQHTQVQARLIVGVLLIARIAYPYYVQSNTIYDRLASTATAIADQDGIGEDSAWLNVFERRINEIPEGPVVIVAASGGGSRAALFASLALQHLAAEPMTWNRETTSTSTATIRNVPRTSVQREISPSTWADHILLISSVSGGSLAAGRFAADPEIARRRVPELQYSTKEELRLRALAKVNGWLGPDVPGEDALSPDRSDANALQRLRLVRAELEDLTSPNRTSTAAMAFSSKIADDMAADFMAPLLRGVLTPFSSRGDCLYHFWEHQFAWENLRQRSAATLADHRTASSTPAATQNSSIPSSEASESVPKGPLVLFNTTDVETGRRVILGFPSLPGGFLASAPEFPVEILDSTGTQTRGKEFGPTSLADFTSVNVTSLSLARAVRLSSNFPWGFGVQQFNAGSIPPVRMKQKAPSVRGDYKRTKIELIDGGVVDNTGIDSIATLFETLFIRADDNPFGREAGILQKLRKRGIAFIEIDSGAKPTGSASEGTAFGDILRPLTALNNSSYTNAIRISDSLIQRLILRFAVSPSAAQLSAFPLSTANPYFELTEDQLKGALPVAVPANTDAEKAIVPIFHFRLSCNHVQDTDADVMTAFALGPDDKATVMAMFLSEAKRWDEWQSKTHNAYSFMQSYFAPKSPQSLTKEFAEHLAFHLIDRTQVELRILKERSNAGETMSEQEQTHSLQRIVTLLLGLRSISDIPSVSDQKSKMWLDLARLTGYLQDTQLASVSHSAPVGAGGSGTALPEPALPPEKQFQLNPDKLITMLQTAQEARQEAAATVTQDSLSAEAMIPDSADPKTSPSYGSGNSSTLSTPYLRDVLRQQSNAVKDAANQSRFFESKK